MVLEIHQYILYDSATPFTGRGRNKENEHSRSAAWNEGQRPQVSLGFHSAPLASERFIFIHVLIIRLPSRVPVQGLPDSPGFWWNFLYAHVRQTPLIRCSYLCYDAATWWIKFPIWTTSHGGRGSRVGEGGDPRYGRGLVRRELWPLSEWHRVWSAVFLAGASNVSRHSLLSIKAQRPCLYPRRCGADLPRSPLLVAQRGVLIPFQTCVENVNVVHSFVCSAKRRSQKISPACDPNWVPLHVDYSYFIAS